MQIDRVLQIIEGICHHFIGRVAFRHFWTTEQISKFYVESICGHPYYEKLPQWAHRQISGYWNAVIRRYESCRFWTHLVDGRRWKAQDPALKDRSKEISETNEIEYNSDFACVFRLDGEVVFVPCSEAIRQRDIERGILSNEILTKISQPGLSKIELLIPDDRFNMACSVY